MLKRDTHQPGEPPSENTPIQFAIEDLKIKNAAKIEAEWHLKSTKRAYHNKRTEPNQLQYNQAHALFKTANDNYERAFKAMTIIIRLQFPKSPKRQTQQLAKVQELLKDLGTTHDLKERLQNLRSPTTPTETTMISKSRR